MYFINFYPYFKNIISLRQEYFSFRPYFCLITDNYEIIYFTITFSPLIFLRYKLIAEQPTTSFPLLLIWFAGHSPCTRQSRTAVSVGSQRSLSSVSLTVDGECTAKPRRLRCESKNLWTGWKNFARRRLHCECAATALRLRRDSWNWKMFNS